MARIARGVSGLAVVLLLGGAGAAHATPVASSAPAGSVGMTASGGLRAAGGGAVVAVFDGNDFEIFRLSGTNGSLTQITFNDFDDLAPRDSGSQVVAWQGFDGNDFEVFRYDGSEIVQLTDNEFDDLAPQFFGSELRWSGFDGNDFELFGYDGSQIVQLTNNEVDDRFAQASELDAPPKSEFGAPSAFQAIPEPGSVALMALGVAMLVGYAACRR